MLIPGVFAFDWIVLPLARARGLLPLAASLAACAILAEAGDLEVLANAAKLGAITFFAFWFLRLFEELVLLVVVAAIVPFVDAYSVFRGPTGNIVEHHSNVFTYFSVYWALPHESNDPRLGIPDVLFFALYLAAAVRFRLRPGWTWLGDGRRPRRDRCDHRLGGRRRASRPPRAVGRLPRPERRPDLAAAAQARRGGP